jgi:prophage tail gpP-like protein
MHEVVLRAGGVEVEGWVSVSIRKSLDQLADEFNLELTNRWLDVRGSTQDTGVSADFVRRAADSLTTSDLCEVVVDGQVVVTGYIDDLGFSYNANSARFTVGGRSKAGDLVDCMAFKGTTTHQRADKKKGTKKNRFLWTDASLAQIAGDLCSPFGIQCLVSGVSDAPFKRFRIEPGESVFEALSRAAEIRGAIPISTPDGDIAFVRSSGISSGAVIELGVNVLEGSIQKSLRGRFSDYLFRGQTFTDDTVNGVKASELEGAVQDDAVPRYRPCLVIGQHQGNNEDMGARAIWERNVRAGRSVRHRYTLESWLNSAGNPWETNTLVKIVDRWCGVDSEKLVCSIDFSMDPSGYTSQLELVDASAFSLSKTVKLPKLSLTVSVGDAVVV